MTPRVGGLSRRGLLRAGLVGVAWAGGLVRLPRRGGAVLGSILGPGRRSVDGRTAGDLTIVDLDRPAAPPRVIETDFFGHGLALDPTRPGRALLFEKRGPGACELDLEAGVVVGPLRTRGREFYGHGAFTPDGATLFATETVVEDDYRGVVVVRDGRTLEELGEFPTHGVSPHDCVLTDGGRVLVVTNGGSRVPGGTPPSVTYVDVRSAQLLESVPLENPDVGAGHLALGAAGELVVVSPAREWMSRESLGGAGLRAGDGPLVELAAPPEVAGRLRGEALSVAIHTPTDTVGVTHPGGNLVTFWRLSDGAYRGRLELAFPRGIALTRDGAAFVLSYGKGTSLVRVRPESLEPLPGTRRGSLRMSGSHIVSHVLPSA